MLLVSLLYTLNVIFIDLGAVYYIIGQKYTVKKMTGLITSVLENTKIEWQ